MEESTDIMMSQKSEDTKNHNEQKSENRSLLNMLNFRHSNTCGSECNLHCVKDAWATVCQSFHKPYPVCYPSKEIKVTDPVLYEYTGLQNHHLKIEKVKSLYKKNLKKGNKSNLVNCIKTLNNYFEEICDEGQENNLEWYYTAGSFDIQNIAKDNVLLFHAARNCQFFISKIQQEESCWTHKSSEKIGDDLHVIYQIEAMQKDSSIFACVRHKNDISLYSVVKSEDRFVGNIIDTNCTYIPLTGLSLSKVGNTEYATIDIQRTVNVWDCSSMKQKLEIPYNDNGLSGYPFGQVLYQTRDTLTYLDPNSFYLIDTREGHLACNSSGRSRILPDEDRFSNMCLNTVNNSYYYICTEHCVMHVDIRTMNVVNTWPHSFRKPPFVSCFLYHAGSNVVCLSSLHPNEKLLLCHTEGRFCVPKFLPVLSESFESSIANSPGIDMSPLIRERLDISTTGIQVSEINKDSFTIFASNCSGDVFSYDVTNFELDSIKPVAKKFQEWNKSMKRLSGTGKYLEFVDKGLLNDVPLNTNIKPISKDGHLKSRYLKNCLADLKCRNKEFNAKIHEVWYEKSEPTLEDIEELPRDVTINNWLNEFPNL